MSDDLTDKLPAEPAESRAEAAARVAGIDAVTYGMLDPGTRLVLEVLAGVEARLASVETKIDARDRETRPMGERLDRIIADIAEVRHDVGRLDRRFLELQRDMAERVLKLDDRVSDLERSRS